MERKKSEKLILAMLELFHKGFIDIIVNSGFLQCPRGLKTQVSDRTCPDADLYFHSESVCLELGNISWSLSGIEGRQLALHGAQGTKSKKQRFQRTTRLTSGELRAHLDSAGM
jgi:hypothetical protein